MTRCLIMWIYLFHYIARVIFTTSTHKYIRISIRKYTYAYLYVYLEEKFTSMLLRVLGFLPSILRWNNVPLFLELGVLFGNDTLHSYQPSSDSRIFVRLMLPWPSPWTTAFSSKWIRPAYSSDALDSTPSYQEKTVRPWNGWTFVNCRELTVSSLRFLHPVKCLEYHQPLHF